MTYIYIWHTVHDSSIYITIFHRYRSIKRWNNLYRHYYMLCVYMPTAQCTRIVQSLNAGKLFRVFKIPQLKSRVVQAKPASFPKVFGFSQSVVGSCLGLFGFCISGHHLPPINFNIILNYMLYILNIILSYWHIWYNVIDTKIF